MNWINDDHFVVEAKHSAAVVQLSELRDHTFGTSVSPRWVTEKHVRWGELDQQPNTLSHLLEKNGQVLATLDTHRDMLFGRGITFKKKVVEGTKVVGSEEYFDARLEDLMGKHRLNFYYMDLIVQMMTNGNAFTRFAWDAAQKEFSPMVTDAFFTRIGLPFERRPVSEYHYNPYFGDSYQTWKRYESDVIQKYNAADPAANIVSMLHSKAPRSGNPFYSYPSWWATEDWISLANLIPVFHKNGILNGYNIKYLIKMPKDYFDKEAGRELSSEKVRAKWTAFSKNLKTWMSGTKGVNKSLIVKYLRGDDGKALDSIDVVPLKNEMSDDAYSKVWEMANLSIANAAGILPTLAGVNPGKGNDSGSQIRVMADFQQHFRTGAMREIMFEPIKIWLRNNGFPPEVFPDVNSIQITTLDVEKKGTQETTNNKPAA